MSDYERHSAGKKLLRTIVVEVYEENLIDVREGDRYCDGLTWDEALGQIAELTHPKLGEARYSMLTEDGWRNRWNRVRGDQASVVASLTTSKGETT